MESDNKNYRRISTTIFIAAYTINLLIFAKVDTASILQEILLCILIKCTGLCIAYGTFLIIVSTNYIKNKEEFRFEFKRLFNLYFAFAIVDCIVCVLRQYV